MVYEESGRPMANKKSVRVLGKEVMQAKNYDPLEELVTLAQDPNTPKQSKQAIAETLLPYMYPKLTNVTVEGEVNVNHTAEMQVSLLRRVLEDPQLADAAQQLSIAASNIAIEEALFVEG